MNLKINFLKLKKEKQFKKKKVSVDVNSYWKLLLVVNLFVLIFAFVFGIVLFVQISKDFKTPVVVTGSQLEKVKKERINSVLNYFKTKEDKTNSILANPAGIVDPSR
jgi:uncharacterized membrane protein